MPPDVETPVREQPTPPPVEEETQETPPPVEPAPEEPDEEEEEDEEEREPKTPDLNALLDKADPEALRKHKRIAGIAGELAKKLATREAERLAQTRVEELFAERQRMAKAEADRQALVEAARKGEFYALGEQVSKNVLLEDQQRFMGQYEAQAKNQAFSGVQTVVDRIAEGFDPAVIEAAAQEIGEIAPGTSWEAGFERWLPALIKAQAAHLAANPETRKQVEREVTPAVRSRALAELNGAEPVADSGSGRPQKAKTITDEQIAAMEPEQWMEVYDVDKGTFKPGYVYKPTRAIDPRNLQVAGRGF